MVCEFCPECLLIPMVHVPVDPHAQCGDQCEAVPPADIEKFKFAIMGYRHPTNVNLFDGKYMQEGGEFLCLYEKPPNCKGESTWWRPYKPWFDTNIKEFIKKFVEGPRTVSIGYFAAIEDVQVGKIISETESHYTLTIVGFSESFSEEFFHCMLKERIEKTFRCFSKQGQVCFEAPKHQIKYIYPSAISQWEEQGRKTAELNGSADTKAINIAFEALLDNADGRTCDYVNKLPHLPQLDLISPPGCATEPEKPQKKTKKCGKNKPSKPAEKPTQKPTKSMPAPSKHSKSTNNR